MQLLSPPKVVIAVFDRQRHRLERRRDTTEGLDNPASFRDRLGVTATTKGTT